MSKSESNNSIEQMTLFKTPEESPGYLLWRISNSWKTSIEEVLKPLNLTHPQFVILATTAWLTRNNKHVNQIDISKTSGLDPTTTSQVLRGLEAKDFITRIRSLNERNKNPKLTILGNNVLSKAIPTVENADAKFFGSLNIQSMNELIKTFQELI